MMGTKWSGFNSDYNFFYNYHARIGHHTPFQDFTIEKHNCHHFPRQFNREFYDVIQGERMINTPRHVKDVQAEGDGVYTPPNGHDIKDSFILLQASMMQELMGDDYMLDEQANDEPQTTNPFA